MLEQIILRKFYLLKHLQAPLLKERESYVKYLHCKGLSRRYLLSVADYLLRIIQLLNLNDKECRLVTLSSIEVAADVWSNMILNHPMRRKHPSTSKDKFISIAIEWLKYIGRLEPMYEDPNLLSNEIFLDVFPRKNI